MVVICVVVEGKSENSVVFCAETAHIVHSGIQITSDRQISSHSSLHKGNGIV